MPKKPGSPLTLEPNEPTLAPPEGAEAPPPVPDLSSSPPDEPIPLATPTVGEPEKKRRHRRTKAQLAAEAAELEAGPPPPTPEDIERTAAAFAVTFRALTSALAKRRGEHWLLTDEETGTLGSVWAQAVAPYLHKVGPAMPWVSATIVTWSIFQPRIAIEQAKKELAAGTPPPAV